MEPAGTQGILTTAYGPSRYRDLAITLARSLDRHSPEIRRAVITDTVDARLDSLYAFRVPLVAERGRGLVQKLWLLEYSPFERTLFLDADCLVVRDVSFLWELFAGHPFAAVGARHATDGFWFGDIADRCRRFGLESIPVFNGGLYYFERCDAATEVAADARALADRYDEFGFIRMGNGSINDEVVLSLAIARNPGGSLVDDDGRAMRTPLDIRGPLTIDVLRGSGSFVKGQHRVEPAVIHFCGPWAERFYYRRERLKLTMVARGVPPGIAGPMVNAATAAARVPVRLTRRAASVGTRMVGGRPLSTLDRLARILRRRR